MQALTEPLGTDGDRRELTEERAAAIVRLLEALTVGLPEPARAPMSTLGFVHRTSSRESCPDCLTNGFVSRDCETCNGHGYLEERRTRDPYDTGQSQGWFGSSAARHARVRERDQEIDRLDAQIAPPKPEVLLVAETRPDRWETDRDRLRSRYHVAEVEGLLEVLLLVDVDAYRAVHAVHVYGWMPAAGRAADAVARAVSFLSDRLPVKLLAPPGKSVEAVRPMTVAERNREIRKLVKEGAASQWVAVRFGLSVSQVNRVVAGEEVAA